MHLIHTFKIAIVYILSLWWYISTENITALEAIIEHQQSQERIKKKKQFLFTLFETESCITKSSSLDY